MLRSLLKTLKNTDGINSNKLIKDGLDYLIPDEKVYLIYSIKFEVSGLGFRDYFRKILNSIITNDGEFYNQVMDTCVDWYIYMLDNKTLVKSTSSLKSDLRRIYKKYKNRLDGFDRFYEKVYHAFLEAYNTYDIVFYNPTAILNNKDFSTDRHSCFIDSKNDYLDVLKQTSAYYVMIYKDKEPFSRVWVVCDKDYKNIAVFNPYGFRFKNMDKFFSNSNDEFMEGDRYKLARTIGVYVNDDPVFIYGDYKDLVCDVVCPTCKNLTTSDTLHYEDRIRCVNCGDVVYSTLYNRYIPEVDAVYSDYYKTYIYVSDAVYSYYYETYLLDDDNLVYSEALDSYIDKKDPNFVYVNGDYIFKESLEIVWNIILVSIWVSNNRI